MKLFVFKILFFVLGIFVTIVYFGINGPLVIGKSECSIIGNNKYIVHLLGHDVPKEKISFVLANRQSYYELLFK